MSQQIPLSVALQDDARFANFYSSENEPVVHALQQQWQSTGESFLFLAGPEGVGKSHLLQASCHFADGLGYSSVYIPLNELKEYGPSVLEGLEAMSLVALDHLDAVVEEQSWQVGLFHLFNRIIDNGGRLIVAAQHNPAALTISLADLKSRMSWGAVYAVHPLSDEEKCAALQMRAEKRGFSLNQEVARFLLSREQRDMASLLTSLDRLDHASLASQRKLTIPFVKETLDW